MTATLEVKLRAMPESVTLTGEHYIELLGVLEGVSTVFAELNGTCAPTPADEAALGDAISNLDGLVGKVGPEDEAWERDPIILAFQERGNVIASKILLAMSETDGHGLIGILPEGLSHRLWRASNDLLRTRA